MSISPNIEARGSEDCHIWNIIMYWNGKVDSLYGWMLQKLLIISKNVQNTELNLLQKTKRKYIYIYLRSGASGLQWYAISEILLYTSIGKLVYFRGERYQKYWLCRKMLHSNAVQN